jgi:hypothetical protein
MPARPTQRKQAKKSPIRPNREHLPASALPEVLGRLGEIAFGAVHGNHVAVADGMKNLGKVGKKKR